MHAKNLIGSVILSFVLALLVPVIFQTDSAQAASVKLAHGANQVYVRNAPTVHGKLLTTLPKNEPLYIYGKIGSWYKIRYQKGVAYTYKTHVASGAPILWYKGYGADKVYVRDLGSGNVLGTLPPMTALNVYAKQGNWLTIGYKGGYAHTYYTHVKSGTPKVLYTGYGADKVYVRDLSSGNVLGTLPPMTALKVYAKLGNWLVIGYNGGYAETYYTHVKSGTPTVLYTGYGVDDIYVRDLSDGHHLTTLPKNTSVKVYAVLGNWLVIGYNGGYAKTYYTHVQKGTPPTSTATSNAVTAVTVTSPSPGTQTTSSTSPTSTTRTGIDVSRYQGTIDFNKVKAAGCSFVIVKATQGTTGTDPNFLSNINAANAAGLQTNAYHYYEAGTESEAKAEANHFISVLKQADVKGYVFVDVESNSTVDALDKETLTSEVNVFLDQLASAGYTKLGIYSNKSFYENNLDDAKLRPGLLLWLARYNTELGVDADIWQYTDQGTIDGITGSVDIDISYTDEIGS